MFKKAFSLLLKLLKSKGGVSFHFSFLHADSFHLKYLHLFHFYLKQKLKFRVTL